ncbi:MAG: site-specific integrase [Rhodanobacter sp.]
MTKQVAKLSPRIIESAKPMAKPYRVWDSAVPSLHLRVQPSGVKTFNVQWSRSTTRSLGKWPGVTVDAARKRARTMLTEVDQAGAPLAVIEKLAGAPLTFGDFMRDHYAPVIKVTNKAGAQTLAMIAHHFGYLYDRPMTEITVEEIENFKKRRKLAGILPATINRDVARLKSALSKAVKWKQLDANPLMGMEREKREIEERVRYLSPREEKALRATLQARDARFRKRRLSGNEWREERGREPLEAIEGYADHLTPMTLLALNTGMRRGELTNITWTDIDLEAKQVTIPAKIAKNGKARSIPLNTEAIAILTQWKTQEPEGRLFKVFSIYKAWLQLMTDADIQDFHFHDLRHTFASKLVMAGVNLYVVSKLLGHSSIAMTERYSHVATEHRAAAVELLMGVVW